MATLTQQQTTGAPPAAPSSAPPSAAAVPQIRDSSSPLLVYVALLFGLPSGLVFEPLGAAGAPASVLGMGFLAWWLNARLVPRLGVSRGRQPIRIALYVFLASAALSFLAGALRPMTSEEASSSARGVLTVCAWAGVVLVTADGLRSRESVDRLLQFVVGAGAFLATLGLIQFFSGWNPASLIMVPGLHMNGAVGSIARGNFTRVQGTAAHAIEFGVVLAMVLPLAFHYAWFATDHKRRRWLAVMLIGFALPLTVSRSAIIGVTIVLAVLLMSWTPERRWKLIRLLPVLAVVLKLMVPGLLGALKGLFANISNDPSTQGRTDDYAAVGYYVDRAPFFGRGLSTFIPELYRTLDNAYLGWLIEAGLLGLLALVGFMVMAVGTALHIRTRARGDEKTRDLGSSLAAGLLAAAFNFATFDALGFAMCAGLVFLLVGATGALWRLAPAASDLDTRTLPRIRWTERLSASRTALALLAQAAGAAAGAGLMMMPGIVGTEYSASASVQLFSPQQSGNQANPYVYSPYLDLPSEIIQRLVMSPQTAADLKARGFSDRYTVAAGIGSLMPMTDKMGRGPLIFIDVRADSADQALRSRDAVVQTLQDTWRASQAGVGSPATEFIPAKVASSADSAFQIKGRQKQALVVAAGLGAAAGGSSWYLLGSWRRSRARRKALAQRAGPGAASSPVMSARRTDERRR